MKSETKPRLRIVKRESNLEEISQLHLKFDFYQPFSEEYKDKKRILEEIGL